MARTESQLNKQAKQTTFYHFSERISIAEHWKLDAESYEFHLTLSRVHLERIFSNLKYAKKAGHFKSKAGERDDAKKREFTPESGSVDTYVMRKSPTERTAGARTGRE